MTDSTISNIPIKKHHVLAAIVVLIILIVVYIFRHRIIGYVDRYRMRNRVSLYTPLDVSGSFQEDLEAGLHSDNFSLSSNIADGDPRTLQEEAKATITQIMESEGLSFDEARLAYTQRELERNNVDSTGLPRDPRLVTMDGRR